MNDVATVLTAICAVGAAMASGTFFDFSTFAMRGLKRLPPARGAAAMQEINREAPTPLFMTVLFGTGLAFVGLAIHAALTPDDDATALRLAAAALYLVGVVVMTIAYHVPRNNRLDAVDPTTDAGQAYWATYYDEWLRMNHVRTLAPLAAAVLLVIALATT